jgi:hypothetical protein
MGRKRKGKAPHGKFAQIPVNVAKGVLAGLSAPEFRVWFCLCLQCQHWSNGTGKLCRSVIREFHLGSQRVVTAATKKLIARGHIIKTRSARQRVCALYGVTHLPLNTDAMASEGLSDDEIRSVLRRFAAVVSDTNRGSANSATTSEALNVKNDIRGSAKPSEPPLALPHGNRNGTFSTPLALPQGNTSKNLPCLKDGKEGFEGSDWASNSPPKAGGRISNIDERIRKARKHLAADPNADSATLARMYRLTSTEVQQLKASA